MQTRPAICPMCGKTDAVEKVSVLYLTGLGMRTPGGSPRDAGGGVRAARALSIDIPDVPALSRKLAPPASQKQAFMRAVHPDIAVLAFSLILPFFLYGILTSQAEMLPVVLAILAVFYLVYFLERKRLVSRFQAEQAKQKADAERIQHGIERWMRLYYCARDDGVFEPGEDELAPVDMMMGYLLREA